MIRRVLVAAAMVASAVVVAVPTGSAQATGCGVRFDCVTWYYSDAAHTTVIGASSILCDNGGTQSWGSTSIYTSEQIATCVGNQ